MLVLLLFALLTVRVQSRARRAAKLLSASSLNNVAISGVGALPAERLARAWGVLGGTGGYWGDPYGVYPSGSNAVGRRFLIVRATNHGFTERQPVNGVVFSLTTNRSKTLFYAETVDFVPTRNGRRSGVARLSIFQHLPYISRFMV